MLNLVLQRLNLSSIGTYGVLMKLTDAGSVPFLLTCEDAWNNNEEFNSCIPSGVYTCRKTVSPRFGTTFEVTNVKDRTNILFHSGNDPGDTRGCILTGLSYRFPVIGLTQSRDGFMRFWDLVKDFSEFQLVIKDPA